MPAIFLPRGIESHDHHVVQVTLLQHLQHFFMVKSCIGTHAANANVRRQILQQLTDELRRLVGALRIAVAQPETRHQLWFSQTGNQRSMTGFQANGGMSRTDSFLMPIPVQ